MVSKVNSCSSKKRVLFVGRKRFPEKPIFDFLLEKSIVDYRHLDIFSLNKVKVILLLFKGFKLILTYKPHVVITDRQGVIGLYAFLLAKVSNSKFVSRVKGNFLVEFEEKMNLSSWLGKAKCRINRKATLYVLRMAEVVSPISLYVKKMLENIGEINVGKVVHIPLRNFSADTGDVSDVELIISDAPFVLTVTNFNFLGKVQILPSYIALLAPQLRELGYKWIIAGDGVYWNEIKNAIDLLDVSDVIQFCGYVKTKVYMQRAKAHIYISSLDAFPNSIIEGFYFDLLTIVNRELPVDEIKYSGGVKVIDLYDHDKMLIEFFNQKNHHSSFKRLSSKYLESLKVENLSQDFYKECLCI